MITLVTPVKRQKTEEEVKAFFEDLCRLQPKANPEGKPLSRGDQAVKQAIDAFKDKVLNEDGSLDWFVFEFHVPNWIRVEENRLQERIKQELDRIQYCYVEEEEILDGWEGKEVLNTSGFSRRQVAHPSMELKLKSYSCWKKQYKAFMAAEAFTLKVSSIPKGKYEASKLQRRWDLNSGPAYVEVHNDYDAFFTVVKRKKKVLGLPQERGNREALELVGSLRDDLYELEAIRAKFVEVKTFVDEFSKGEN